MVVRSSDRCVPLAAFDNAYPPGKYLEDCHVKFQSLIDVHQNDGLPTFVRKSLWYDAPNFLSQGPVAMIQAITASEYSSDNDCSICLSEFRDGEDWENFDVQPSVPPWVLK